MIILSIEHGIEHVEIYPGTIPDNKEKVPGKWS